MTGWSSSAVTTLSSSISAGATSFTVASAAGFVLSPQYNSGTNTYTGFYLASMGTDTGISCATLASNTFSGCTGIAASHSSSAAVGTNTYAWPNFGIKLVKFGTGTVHIDSVETYVASSNGFWNGAQGSATPYCSTSTASVNYAADGVTPLSPAVPGYLCFVPDQYGDIDYRVIMPSTGESRNLSATPNISPIPAGPSPTTFFVYNTSTDEIGQCVYNSAAAQWAALPAYSNTGSLNPNISCSYTLSNSIATEVAADTVHRGNSIDQTYFGAPQWQSTDCPGGPTVTGCDFLFMFRPAQGSVAWFCTIDVSITPGAGQVVNCYNTWDTQPIRWLVEHGGPYYAGNYGGTTYVFNSALIAMSETGNPGSGPFQMVLNSIANNGGATALTSSFTDPRTCQAIVTAEGGGTIPANLASQITGGASATQCIEATVATDPVETSPQSADLTPFSGGVVAGDRPGPWVHNSTACGGDNTTANCWSSLQALAPGDEVIDSAGIVAGSQSNTELFLVLNREVTGSTITLTLARGAASSGNCSVGMQSHTSGFGLTVYPQMSCGETAAWLIKGMGTASAIPDIATLFSGHSGSMTPPGIGNLLNYEPVSYYVPNDVGGIAYAARNALIPSGIGAGFSYSLQEQMGFGASGQPLNFAGLGYLTGNNIQFHPGEGGTTTTPSIFPDGTPIGGSGGGQIPQWSQSATLATGNTVYLVGIANNSSVNIYSLSTYNLKTRSLFAFAGYHLLYDLSGPGSVISDATPWAFCVAYNAGECVSGSTQWNVYEAVPSANTAGTCEQDGTIYTPCFVIGPAIAGQYNEHQVDQGDPFGLYWRNETACLNGPNRAINYANMHGLATGDWNVCGAQWANGQRADLFGVLNPPWQPSSTNHNYFTQVSVGSSFPTGTSIRARFGYGTNLYCSSRQEVCTTAAGNSDPFAYLSETQSWTACTTNQPCTVQIPAIAGKVLYYVLDSEVGSAITSGPMQVVPVH